MRNTQFWPVLALFLVLGSGLASAETTTFEDPMQGRYRLDYCRYEGVDCGIAAAFAYCQQVGYQQIEGYRGERDVRYTERIGDRSTCHTDDITHCDGFYSITCSRDHAPPAIRTGPGSENYPVRPDTNDDSDGGGDDSAD